MVLPKPTTFLTHLGTLLRAARGRHGTSCICTRFFSFATPEEAAAERRRRKRRLRIEPPVSSARPTSPPSSQQRQPPSFANPNAPKLPEHVSALTGNRLNLHNRILRLIRENDLDEATLLTRHSIYSNCRPTIFTVNAVLNALFRQSRYADLLSLHRFITQAGVGVNIITHNLLLNAYCDCRKTDLALEHYKQLINDAPVNPSPTTYRVLVKGLVDNDKVDRAVEIKDDMLTKGIAPDPIVYNYLMHGHAKNKNPDGIFSLYEELKEKAAGSVSNGIVYGSLMRGFFLKGMEKEAMECYAETVCENSKVKKNPMAFNFILDALSKHGKFEEALKLFEKMLTEHDPPLLPTVNLGSFNVMADAYCSLGKFADAIDTFRRMHEKKCEADASSYNNLIDQLCDGELLVRAEELYGEMIERGVNPDEHTYVLLIDACFKENRADDASRYFNKVIEAGLRPNLSVYNKLVEGLVGAGKVDDAKSFYDMMIKKLKMSEASYQYMMKALFDAGKADDVLKMISDVLDSDPTDFTSDLQEFVKAELSKEGREDDVVKLVEDKEREKAEARAREIAAAEAAKASARAAIASLIPKKVKESEPVDSIDSIGVLGDPNSATMVGVQGLQPEHQQGVGPVDPNGREGERADSDIVTA